MVSVWERVYPSIAVEWLRVWERVYPSIAVGVVSVWERVYPSIAVEWLRVWERVYPSIAVEWLRRSSAFCCARRNSQGEGWRGNASRDKPSPTP